MIVLNVTYKCKPGMREAFLDAINAEGLGEACRKEEGNIKYDYYMSTADENEMLLVEKWRDEEVLAVHGWRAHFLRIGQLKAEFVEETVIEKYFTE